ncbi:hypothetical protein F183_A23560 [Bryobacterales bacterium F-183]|nr:hypothetical protein F183_A23560 [Bryobacterales bacterium F-183]
MPLGFEWDSRKATANSRKHGVSFEEAITVFNDPLAKIHDDVIHSADEPREIIVGRSRSNRLLLVCFKQVAETRIRIISSREPTPKERHEYQEEI